MKEFDNKICDWKGKQGKAKTKIKRDIVFIWTKKKMKRQTENENGNL